MGTVDDVRVQSGYPLWNLVDAWMGAGYEDDVLTHAYHLDPAEWAAAKQYYLSGGAKTPGLSLGGGSAARPPSATQGVIGATATGALTRGVLALSA